MPARQGLNRGLLHTETIRLMKQLWLTAKLDIIESLRARWFMIYTLVFGGIVALLFLFGLTESRVLGFIGLSRLLVTYIQLTMAILPIQQASQ